MKVRSGLHSTRIAIVLDCMEGRGESVRPNNSILRLLLLHVAFNSRVSKNGARKSASHLVWLCRYVRAYAHRTYLEKYSVQGHG